MFCRTFFRVTAVSLLLLASSDQAVAVINIDMPVAKIFESVKAVAVATVTAVNSENRVIELKTVETLKGTPLADVFRVQIVTPADLIAKVTADLPLVIFTGEDLGKPVALVHVSNTWLLAEFLPAAKVPAWRVIQAYEGKRSFAGSTPDLVKIVTELKTAAAKR